ncbi:MAG: phosphatidylglycerophosphatase A [Phycisphaerales bacterium]
MVIDAVKNRHRAPIKPLNAPTVLLTSCGLGFLRPAPGTWGSMPPGAIVGVMALAGASQDAMLIVTAAVLVLSCVICVAWGTYAEARFGRKDAAEVVIDETAGVAPATMVAVWLAGGLIELIVALGAAFVLFRVFDIIKPPPARQLEKLPRGWGVLIDDLAAGVYAAAALAGAMLAWRAIV